MNNFCVSSQYTSDVGIAGILPAIGTVKSNTCLLYTILLSLAKINSKFIKNMISLKEKLKQLPKKPGVYIFKDKLGKIIYIGKALSLKHRVASYFQKNKKDQKTLELVENIADLQTILVNSEFEALLLEAKLIKQHQPKYNIQAKDGKSYLYIVIGKLFPNRIYSSRKPESEEKLLDWYGPFPSSKDVREILRFIRRIFPFRSCEKLPKSACLYYHLKLCPGVCIYQDGRMTGNSEQSREQDNRKQDNSEQSREQDNRMAGNSEQSDYQKTITQIRQILSGKTGGLIKCLEKEMKAFAKENNFEEAQKNKYKIDALKRITSGWKSVPKEYQEYSKSLEEIKDMLIKYAGINVIAISKIEGYDVSNLSSSIIVGSMVAFVNGEPDTSQYRKFNLKGYFDFVKEKEYDSQDDPEGIRQILKRRLNHPEWIFPQLILIDGGKTQVSAAFSTLKEKGLENQIGLLGLTKEEETIVVPQIKERIIKSWKILRLPRSSSALKLLQYVRDESHRFAQKYYSLLNKKRTLK